MSIFEDQTPINTADLADSFLCKAEEGGNSINDLQENVAPSLIVEPTQYKKTETNAKRYQKPSKMTLWATQDIESRSELSGEEIGTPMFARKPSIFNFGDCQNTSPNQI